MADEAAYGNMTFYATPSTINVSIPGLLTLPNVVNVSMVIDGDVTYEPYKVGSMNITGQGSFTFIPFSFVDCGTNCGANGWYELHSLIMPMGEPFLSVCFGIVYLLLGKSNSATLQYGICFPSLNRMPYVALSASWSGNLTEVGLSTTDNTMTSTTNFVSTDSSTSGGSTSGSSNSGGSGSSNSMTSYQDYHGSNHGFKLEFFILILLCFMLFM